MALLRKLGIGIVSYLDDMLIIDRTRDKAVALPDSHSFASVPKICYKSEKVSDDTSSGDRISGNDSQFKGNNYHSFTERFTINKKMCQYLYQNPQTTVLELTKVLDHLASTVLVIVPAKLRCHFLQQQQIQALIKNGTYKNQVSMNKECQMELLW